jgi:hypothetical protein
MVTSCSDVCDKLIELMCSKCLLYNKSCMTEDQDANYDQIIICLNDEFRR